MSAAKHTPGAARAAMLALRARGFAIREAWFRGQYDGMHAIKQVGPHRIEVYVGSADDGGHYAPVVYLDDVAIARSVATVEKAARIADFRAAVCRAAIARAEGSANHG